MNDVFGIISDITSITRYNKYEVVTQLNIVKSMVNLIPKEEFKSSSKFLDPAVKSGRFLAEIYRRLMDSEDMQK